MEAKDFVLDIHVLFNNNELINLEMQIANLGNWRERSLSYLCRIFDNLCRGDGYEKVKPTTHIGFLNFSPTDGEPEFYATYRMLNVKNHELYSDKFTLSLVNLTKIELATEEDKAYQIDHWARLFVSKTWEDLKMIAKNNDIFSEVSQSLYVLNADERVKEQCRARQDYENHERYVNETIAQLTEENHVLLEELNALKKQLSEANKNE